MSYDKTDRGVGCLGITLALALVGIMTACAAAPALSRVSPSAAVPFVTPAQTSPAIRPGIPVSDRGSLDQPDVVGEYLDQNQAAHYACAQSNGRGCWEGQMDGYGWGWYSWDGQQDNLAYCVSGQG